MTLCFVHLCVQAQCVELNATQNIDLFFCTNTSTRCTFPRGMQSNGVMVLPFLEPYLWICAGSVASRNSLSSELHLLWSAAAHWMFHSLAPSPLFLVLPFKLCSLRFVWLRSVEWFVESIHTHDESVIEFSGAAVMSSVLFSTYGAHGAVKDQFLFECMVRQYSYWYTLHLSTMTLRCTVLCWSHRTAPWLLVYKHCCSTPVNQQQWYCTTIHTGCITILELFRCMTCTVHWHCKSAWHLLYTGAVSLHDMYCTQVGWCCSCCHLYCWSCS
jgi:hypothetical protein